MAPRKKRPISVSLSFNRMIVIAAILWTVVCAGSVVYHVIDSKRHIIALARETAVESLEKDLLYRYWVAGLGGIYVPVTEKTPPNPYLSDVKERDVTTPSGRRLTLMNPAYMTRQVHELGRDFTGVQGHITSLKPIRPENAPDAWETQALRTIEAGAGEYGGIADYEGQRHYRLMYPLYITKPCLACHAAQGYKLGDLRGGISAAIPMSAFSFISRDHIASELKHFGVIWVLGLVVASLVVPFVRRRIEDQEQAEAIVVRNWEFTQSIIDNEPECVKILGPQGELKFMNRAGLAMIDADSMDAVIGRPVQQLVVPEHREAFVRLNERVMAGDGGTLEFEMIGLKGTRRWLETHAVPLRSADGTVELLGITRDVTERKRAEQALRESEERLREAQYIGRIGSWEFFVATRALWWSDEVYALFGMDPAKGVDFDTFLKRIHGEDRERVRASVQDAIQRVLTAWQIEYRIVLDSGEIRHLYESATVDRDAAGSIVRRRGIVQDITERKQSEVALRESEQRLSDAQTIAHLGSWSYDFSSGRTEWSHELYRIYGIDPAQKPSGWPEGHRLIWHPEDWPRVSAIVGQGMAEGAAYAFETRLAGDGPVRWIYVKGEPHRAADSAVTGFTGIVQDITERKRAEQQKEHLEQQLLQSQKIESVGRLAGGIAHDINNMLTPILGYAELLAYKIPADDSRREDLDEITGAAKRVKDMTQQLLAFARKQTLDMRALDVNAVITRFGRMLRRTLRENVLIKLALAPSIGTVLADERQLEQVILNLAVNAQDAMPEGGVLMISTKDVVLDGSFVEAHPGAFPGKHLLITVADTGMGMNGRILDKLFEPFFTTKESGRGTGLGLATVYGIIKQHKGYIDVQSEPRQGATFSLYLPVTGDAVESEVCAEQAGVHRGAETVLLVEDQEQVLRLASLMLRENGYHVLTALSGREALEKAGSCAGEINLMISDVIMPDMNGKELFERIREVRKDIKVLYMSGYPAEVISSQGVLDSGINFIRKPFSVHEFAAKVRRVLDGQGA